MFRIAAVELGAEVTSDNSKGRSPILGLVRNVSCQTLDSGALVVANEHSIGLAAQGLVTRPVAKEWHHELL